MARSPERPDRLDRSVTELDVQVVSVLTDLHEDVMQRVFATGVGLQALVDQVPDSVVRERLRQHIADLDDTLTEIRVTLLDVREDLLGLRETLSRTV